MINMNETNLILPPMQSFQFFDPLRFGLEFLYALIITAMFLFIFYNTKSLFNLTKYKGIEYFRITFLLFALAFFSRLLFFVIRLILIKSQIHIPGRFISFISLILITYFSTLAIGYLIYSTQWKKFNHKYFLIIINFLAIVTITLFYLKNSLIYFLLIQLALMIILLYVNAKKKIRFVYPLISLFWILNLIIFHTRNLLGFEIKLILQTTSIILLGYFIYRILKWTK